MKKLRYPFNKTTRPDWVAIPFDASDRESGVFEVRVQDLPQEKYKTLNYQLQAANSSYNIVIAEMAKAEVLATGEGPIPTSSDLTEALKVISESEKITPAIKRSLTDCIYLLGKHRGEVVDAEESRRPFLSLLRSRAPDFGPFGYSVLSFAESLDSCDSIRAHQVIAESFENRLAESLAAIARAREKIVAFGVTGHRRLIGELVDDQGVPMVDDQGAQLEAPIPFHSGQWVWNNKKRLGTAPETLEFYQKANPSGGLLVSLSEAVLLYQNGSHPTLEDLYQNPAEEPKEVKGKEDSPKSDELQAQEVTKPPHPDDAPVENPSSPLD